VGFVALAIFHALRVFNLWYARGDKLSMAPTRQDFLDLGSLLRYLVSKGGKRPQAGRYSIEEKLTYWWLMGCSLLLVLTAFLLWAPVLVSKYLPDIAMPAARTIHSLTGLLVVLTLLPWHLYHTLIKERNASIFTGVLSEDEMLQNHPLEYQEIMAAVDELRQIQTRQQGDDAAPRLNGGSKAALDRPAAEPGD
jgi:cytochrome b subunit of formate dehydrogenase